ncbi:MFS transporter [Cryptosporangium phraense]|uniref:MFS transporter n=1 Tax=Cryptosporangium phraense TaxID=2593070 RepID=A0A545AMH7_9ACTN|nr:MFS transporter [Cryptosporangium phraense]TQS42512.1 MFS transporter [Cryptosporangium phraense]
MTATTVERTDGRAAVAVFLLNGLTMSTYIVRLPALKHDLGLGDATVGAIGVVFALSALAAMQGVGGLVRRFGTAAVLRVSLAGLPVLLAATGLSGNVITLAVAVAALGAVHGTTDTAMNAHAVAVERRTGPLLNRCHAAWSISTVTASLASAGAARLDLGTGVFVVSVSGALLVAGLALGRGLRAPGAAPRLPDSREPARWTRPLVLLGVTGTVLMVCEGAALGWGVLLVRDAKGATLGVATLAVTAYTAAQTAARLLGDRLTTRVQAPTIFRAGLALAALGFGASALAPGPWFAVAAFTVMGLGMAFPLPLAFSAVGTLAGDEVAPAMARFTTFTYGGILLGPALVGGVAEFTGLPAVVATLAAVLVSVNLAYRLPS